MTSKNIQLTPARKPAAEPQRGILSQWQKFGCVLGDKFSSFLAADSKGEGTVLLLLHSFGLICINIRREELQPSPYLLAAVTFYKYSVT